MPRLLEVRALEAFYGATQALFGIDFDLEEGGITALLGANGAGKTTTLRALCQAVKTRGSIRFDGKAIDGHATEDVVRLGVAHVPDGRGTFGALSVEDNLRLGAYTRRDKAAAGETDRTAGFHRLAQGAQSRGLAGAIGAEQRGDAALLEIEVDAEQRLGGAVEGLQRAHFKQPGHWPPHAFWVRPDRPRSPPDGPGFRPAILQRSCARN